MKMNIYILTFDLNNLSLNELGDVAFKNIRKSLLEIKKCYFIKEVVIIQKCNSVEILIVSEKDIEFFKKELFNFWAKNSNNFKKKYAKSMVTRKNDRAVMHLLRTMCGLKSVLIGDGQVAGQIRNSFKYANDLGVSGKILNKLFSKCRKVYKEVKDKTFVHLGNISLGRAAVDLIKNFDKEIKVLVVGAGEIAEVVIKTLKDNDFKNVYIINRTYKKAKKLADNNSFNALNFDEGLKKVKDFTVAIFTTSKGGLFDLDKKQIKKNLFIIDLGTPRNVTQKKSIRNIKLYSIEDIRRFSIKNLESRLKESEEAKQIIKEKFNEVMMSIEETVEAGKISENISKTKQRLKSRVGKAILILRSRVFNYFRKFFLRRGYIEVHLPSINIVATDPVSSGGELFEVNWYGKKAYLAQSVQLHKQMLILSGFDRIFSMSPFWRAMKNRTLRHNSEAWSLDVESKIKNYQELMSLLEKVIFYVINKVKRNDKKLLTILGVKVKIPKIPFPKITYDDAIRILEKNNVNIEYGEDIGYERELKLSKILRQDIKSDFFFIYLYPDKVKKFYTKSVPNKNLTYTFDLIYNGWEIVSGAHREGNKSRLIKKMIKAGLSSKKYNFYLSLFNRKVPSHGGFGLGLDRFLAKLLGLKDVIETVPFPRTKEKIIP